ncbi:MAG: sugar phosphate nucleotidyltransferase [bacterium]|nr:sugar phosphate nucleotidyltransferase [bacterium]
MENKKLTLLIMAAGMGSRFGGLKQIEPFGPHQEFLIDYSVYDAIKVGFNKVVFIIKEENYELFKETIGNRIADKIEVEYVFQQQNSIPSWVKTPKERTKPWGTAHAIWEAKDKIKEPFAVINADDFYGRDAFLKIAQYLKKTDSLTSNSYALVGYQVGNTLTENGAVKRGVCEVKNNKLVKVTESSIVKENDTLVATPLNSQETFIIKEDTLVSMNMLGFTPTLFPYIEKNLESFFQENKDCLENCEFLIPDVLTKSIQDHYASVEVLPTTSKWIGVTYRQDIPHVLKSLHSLINQGEYPTNLWN